MNTVPTVIHARVRRLDRELLREDLARAQGPVLIVVLCLLPVLLWAFARPPGERFVTLAVALRSLAIAAALAGASAFATNLILGARLKPIAALFGGLDRLYRMHRRLGKLAFLLLLGHAGLITASYAAMSTAAALQLLVPRAGSAVTYGMVALGAMAVAIALTVSGRLKHEVFVAVQRSFGFIFLLGTLHIFGTPSAKAEAPLLGPYLGALSALGLAAFAYRSLFGRFLVPRLEYEVVGVHPLDRMVEEIVLRPRGKQLRFEPGQFVFVAFRSRAPGIGREPHPFSITSAPHQRELRLVVKALGDYTAALRGLEPGAQAWVEGPYGALSYLRSRNPRQVWIAGGIGITPFLSMARSLAGSGHQIDFYYCTENPRETYFLDELFTIGDRNLRVRVIPIGRDRLGWLSAADVEGVSRDLPGKDIFLCGPPAMIRSLRSQFRALGVPARQLHFEEFSFA